MVGNFFAASNTLYRARPHIFVDTGTIRRIAILTIPLELVHAAKAGDRASQETLLETAWPHAFRIAKSILRNDAAAEDAAQEACAAVLGSIQKLRNPAAFGAWFYRLVVRRSLADLKRLRIPASVDSAIFDPTDSHVANIDVRAALSALPVKLRTPLVLYHYAGLTSSEIGQVVGAPSPTVRFRLAQARRAMQRLLGAGDYSTLPKAALP